MKLKGKLKQKYHNPRHPLNAVSSKQKSYICNSSVGRKQSSWLLLCDYNNAAVLQPQGCFDHTLHMQLKVCQKIKDLIKYN